MKDLYRILIADDHPLILEGVKSSLQLASEYAVVGKSRRLDETLEMVAALSPHLLVLDIWMGKESSLDWLDRFHQACPSMKILILSSQKTGSQFRRLTHQAVAGFVLKEEASDFLLQAIRVVASGETWFSSAISSELRRLTEADLADPSRRLTPREGQVLALLRAAKTNADIARELGLSIHSVRRYVTHLYQKLGVSGRTEAVLQKIGS